jgi:hypothetical protein
MKRSRLFFLLLVVCVVIVTAIAFYLYQKPRTSLTNIKADYTLSAKDLYTAFQQDEKKANQKFIEKVIEVSGNVENVEETDSTVNILLLGDSLGGVNCSVKKDADNKIATPVKGKDVKVKGRCVGFLMDVNLVDAIIEN